MSYAQRHRLVALTLVLAACGSDREPSNASPMDDASTSNDVSRDAPGSNDKADGKTATDGLGPADGPTSSDIATRDALSDETSTPAADAADVGPDRDGGATNDVDPRDVDAALPPGPADASSDDGASQGEAAADIDSDSDATPTSDAGTDVSEDADDASTPTDTTNDAAADTSDGAGGGTDGGDASAASGFPGSLLVNSSEGAMINGWVGTPTQLWTLCYTTSLHERSGQAFHTNCDYKGPSVSIARVSYMGNVRVMGGYNSSSWTSPTNGTYANNAGSFLFSVTNSFKHGFPGSSTVPYYTFNNRYYGPTFGAGNDWYVHSQMTFGTCRAGYTYQCRVGTVDSAECNTDFCGTVTSSDYYTLEELEVWVK
jgi:hypothetical protein